MNQNCVCPNCGTENNSVSNFCIGCGSPLPKETQINNVQAPIEQSGVENVVVQPNEPINIVEQPTFNQVNSVNVAPSQPAAPTYNSVSVANSAPLNYLMFIISLLLKPFQSFKSEEHKFNDTKTALIFSGIVAGGMMLINLLTKMISTVFAKTMDLTTLSYKTTIDFSRLENLDYLNLIFKNLLMYAGVILAITGVYFLASLIMKKQINFIKMLVITSSSVVPFAVIGLGAAPILSLIYSDLSIVLMLVGAIYSLIILITLVKEQVDFESKDMEIYFHSICISILGVAGYYFIINLLIKSVTSGITEQLGGYLDMFK